MQVNLFSGCENDKSCNMTPVPPKLKICLFFRNIYFFLQKYFFSRMVVNFSSILIHCCHQWAKKKLIYLLKRQFWGFLLSDVKNGEKLLKIRNSFWANLEIANSRFHNFSEITDVSLYQENYHFYKFWCAIAQENCSKFSSTKTATKWLYLLC